MKELRNKGRGFVAADFETSTPEWLERDGGVARVWLWGIYDPETKNFQHGTDLDGFMKVVLGRRADRCNPIVFFHNLKFDGSYIVNWLIDHGFTYSEDLCNRNMFRTSISDMGLWYYIEVRVDEKRRRVVRFQDSLKKIPLTVAEMPATFGLPPAKGEIDYARYRPPGYEPNDEELEYIYHDCMIVGEALHILAKEGFTAMTIASDAFGHWKETLLTPKHQGKNPRFIYRQYFPVLPLEMDDFVRRAYRGAFVYVNPKYQGRILNNIVSYDENSKYAGVLVNHYLPAGAPIYFQGRPHPDKFQCYIVRLRVRFELKPGHIPCIQLKNCMFFKPTEYITTTEDNIVETVLTNVDLKNLFSQYYVTHCEYMEGYYFKKYRGMFNTFVNAQMAIKERTVGGKRFLAKRRLNSVYGKMATAPRKTKQEPFISEDGSLAFRMKEEEPGDPEFTALAAFVTAWGRYDIIKAAQKNFDNFVYSDTDSLHFIDDGKEPDLPIHPTHLGHYKLEHRAKRAVYLRSKAYIMELEDGTLLVKCAGAPPTVQKQMTFDNFKLPSAEHPEPFVFSGKLMPKQVKGGCVLVNTTFTLR